MKRNKLSMVIASSIVFATFFGSANASEAIDNNSELDDTSDMQKLETETKSESELDDARKIKSNAVSNKQLSQTRMEILQKKLDQNLEKEELSLLKIQNDRAEAEKKLNFAGFDQSNPNAKPTVSSGSNSTEKEEYRYGFDVEEDFEEDYGLLSEKYNLEQNVGFLYKSKSEVMEELINSEEFIAMQNQKDQDAMALLDVEMEEEIIEPPPPPSSKIDSAVIKRIASFGDSKTAKILFKYTITDGDSQSSGKKLISLKEGSTFVVEYETFKTVKINSDGVLIRNTNTNKDMLVLKSL